MVLRSTRALRAPSPCHPRCRAYPENFAVPWPSLLLPSQIMLQSSKLGCGMLITWPLSSPRNQSVPKSFRFYLATLLKSPHSPHAISHVEPAHARMPHVLGAMTPLWQTGCWWGGGVFCERA